MTPPKNLVARHVTRNVVSKALVTCAWVFQTHVHVTLRKGKVSQSESSRFSFSHRSSLLLSRFLCKFFFSFLINLPKRKEVLELIKIEREFVTEGEQMTVMTPSNPFTLVLSFQKD